MATGVSSFKSRMAAAIRPLEMRVDGLSGARLGVLHDRGERRSIHGDYPCDYPWQLPDKSSSVRGLSSW